MVGIEWGSRPADREPIRYRVLRDGEVLAVTTGRTYTDSDVEASRSYRYEVLAEDAAGALVPSMPLAVTVPAASPDGDAPYCPSRLISAMSWHWQEAYTQPNGSDLWSVAWGRDGAVYAFFGDGGGFGGTDTLGRTSFGIARMRGEPTASLGFGSVEALNVYGGYQALHPARLAGKASSIVAVGSDFYALAGIYGPPASDGDSGARRSGSPDHLEIAYSRGNAYSWKVARWRFCSATPESHGAAARLRLAGRFCPSYFVGFGPGYAGAPDRYVYLVGVENSPALWRDVPDGRPARTFLARVPRHALLERTAYRYFAGLDARDRALWSRDPAAMRPIFVDGNRDRPGCGGLCGMSSVLADIVYLPALARYLAVAQGPLLAQTSFYEARNPWGPWSTIEYHNISPETGEGGWGRLGRAAGVSLGVHPVAAWTSEDGRSLWMIFSSNGVAPQGAEFPAAGTALDSFNLVRVDLRVAGAEDGR